MKKFIAVAVVALMMVAMASQAFGLVVADAGSSKLAPVSITNLVVADTYLNPFTVKNWSGIVQQNAYAAGSNIWFIAELTVAGFGDTDAPQYWTGDGGSATLTFTSPTNSLNFTPASQATFAVISGLDVLTASVDRSVIYVNSNKAEYSLSSLPWSWYAVTANANVGRPAPNTNDTLYFNNSPSSLSALLMDAIYDEGVVYFTANGYGERIDTPRRNVKTLAKSYYLHFMAMTNEATEGKCKGVLTVNAGVDTFKIDNDRKFPFYGINGAPNALGSNLDVSINNLVIRLLEAGVSYGARELLEALAVAESIGGLYTPFKWDRQDIPDGDVANFIYTGVGVPVTPPPGNAITTGSTGAWQDRWDNEDSTMLVTYFYNQGEPIVLPVHGGAAYLGMLNMNHKNSVAGRKYAVSVASATTASATTAGIPLGFEADALALDANGLVIKSALGPGRIGSIDLKTTKLYVGERSQIWPLYNSINGEEYRVFKIPNMTGGPYAGKGVLYVITNKDMDENIITFVVDGSTFLGLAKFTNATGFVFGVSDHAIAAGGVNRSSASGGVSGFDFAMDSVLACYYMPVASNDMSSNVVNLQYLNDSTDAAISRTQLQAIFDFFNLAYANPIAPTDKHFLSRSGFTTEAEVSYNVANAIIPTPDTSVTIPKTGDGATGIGIVLAASAILAAAAVGFMLTKRVRG